MKILGGGALCLSLFIAASAAAQDTALLRSEVAAIKAKLTTVQQAMGGDPAGYLQESEDFSLPTEANPAQGGRFWPITSSVRMRFTDRAIERRLRVCTATVAAVIDRRRASQAPAA